MEENKDEVIVDFDLLVVESTAKVKPRIHKGGDDSTCISCEG